MQVKYVLVLLGALSLGSLFYQCSTHMHSKTENNVIFYQDFDLFHLKGINQLQKIDKKQSVEVTYENKLPIFIKYYFPARTVLLSLEDSLRDDENRLIYIYTTSNFFTGSEDGEEVYPGFIEKNKYYLYVSFSDTLICETQSVPKSSQYIFHLFVKEGTANRITQIVSFDDDLGEKNSSLSRRKLYEKWKQKMIQIYTSGSGERKTIEGNIPKSLKSFL